MIHYSFTQLAFLAFVFLAATGLSFGSYWLVRRTSAQKRLERVIGDAGQAEGQDEGKPHWVETVAKAAAPLAKLSVPDEGWETSELRRRFMQAGFRSPSAPVLFFAIKSLLGFGLPVLAVILATATGEDIPMEKFVIFAALACVAGFYGPNLVLNRMIETRKREIFENFPDAIDLLTVCVEAGLGLDGALNRVSKEISLKSRTLAEELQLTCLEFRAGGGKERALRNLALRTGVEDIDVLVAMLVQADKFGTSIGESLRVHSEMLRVKRQQRAEETAAKVAVKLIFPLVLCIFPSILIVVAGPAMIRIVKTLPTLVGGG